MDLRGVHHVSINVTDLDQSLAFYRDTLGLKVLESRPDDVITVDGAWLSCPDGREIHLLVTDLVMMGMGGLELIREAKARGISRVVAMSGWTAAEVRRPRQRSDLRRQSGLLYRR